ncbi:MAG: FliM/FliN family flagellar motor switch protein [bacterium]|nr:FliM/FliN family flagellar motor switch protein [bacterium]
MDPTSESVEVSASQTVEELAVETQANSSGVRGENHPEVKSFGEESVPEFQQLDSKKLPSPGQFDLARFGGVQVELRAELGRAKLSLKELMGLSVGTVIELDRALNSPVELFAQGTPLGNGEVVVVDDRFAIRIKAIY